jgi:BirA family biotin operon repressor/biotin-[acetyl-CoA-carboxylase] ligase
MSVVEDAVPAPPPDRVDSGPPGTRFGEVRRFAEIDSTNRYLLDVARHRPPSSPGGALVAVAAHQGAGRGRLGRSWEAPAGANLLVSVLLAPRAAAAQLQLCNVAMSLAAADACREVAGVEASIKWPNDLVVGERKLAGVLAESTPPPAGAGPRLVVVGMGMNVRWPPPDDAAGSAPVPADLRASATSLWRESGSALEPDSLLWPLLEGLEERLAELDDGSGRQRLAEEYRRRCATLGQHVRVVLGHGEISGDAVDMTPEGQLVVDVGGRRAVVSAGDVVHLHRGS